MYICPTCQKKFKTEVSIQKHFLSCWKEQHPYHQSKAAPHSEDKVTREVSNDIADFFKELNEKS